MTTPVAAEGAGRALRLCLWCVVAVVAEVGLYASYRGHDARFHWFTHFFVGASFALVVMAVVALRRRRAVPVPLVWPFIAHVVAMFPDFLFAAGIAHQRWMDVFLGHISTHFVPGRNLTWFVVFLLALGFYLAVLGRVSPVQEDPDQRFTGSVTGGRS
ncbi:MAG: hypothetical protein KY454_02105 [Actinobacteria bacterium]|nr:hypothetical protein [Actinomycetota bacterium]MBW3649483.1 hypothetical protein [Actinomycetota bacterium]